MNYKSSVESCPIPQEDKGLRENLLNLKVKLGEQNMADASNFSKQHNPQELEEAINQMRSQLGKQDAQINAFASLIGNLTGASNFIRMCFDSQSRAPLDELREELNGNQSRVNNDLKIYIDEKFKQNQEMTVSEIQRAAQFWAPQKQSLESWQASYESFTQRKLN
ncbi:hypothetical protein FGO68_gene7354 [Halteria grandinella]|uniref:Uncharacterized protein n=1 Tax=Halteria grandinella TaxID=5974 RepID=A0A8J8T430_HALGN|nr:hypothetical protein FGO68_gene7354 [Halteria grandinella]